MSNRKKYNNYSVEELLHDQEFITEMKRRNKPEWNEYLSNYPEAEKKMKEARKLFEWMQVNEAGLDQQRKDKLWQQIHKLQVTHRKGGRFFRIRLNVAAAVLLAMLIAGTWYWYSERQKTWIFDEVATLTEKATMQQSILVLADGSKVALQTKESTVTVLNNENAIRINNDSVITLKEEPVQHIARQQPLNEVIVPYGEKTSLLLADGTKVWLNAGSRFAFPTRFSRDKREVFLEGEGYFEVVKDAVHPFVVNSRDVNVKVYGTKFNMSVYPNDAYCETVLLEGSVSVEDNHSVLGKTTKMEPGQIARYTKLGESVSVRKIDHPELYVSWRDGWYQFSDVDLSYVTHKLERYYDIQFRYNEELVKETHRVSGKLDLKDSLQEVLAVVAKVSGVNYDIDGEKIVLTPTKK